MSALARSILLAFLALTAWLALGAAVAWSADGAWWSAALLFAEPLLLVVGAVIGVGLLVSRAGFVATGWTVGMLTFALVIRFPRPGSSEVGSTPSWIGDAQNCAGALDLPTGSFTLLQWTLDPSVSDADVADVVRRSTADVVVLYDITRVSTADTVDDVLGGESRLIGAEPHAFGLFTRGVLNLCGDAEVLLPLRTEEQGWALAFVGTADGATFPLLFGALPRLDEPDWADATRVERMMIGSVAGAMQSSKLVIALDTGGPWTWTRLNARFAAMGMRLGWAPPDWPRQLGPVPWLPLHAMQRVWSGPAWRPVQSVVLQSRAGVRAPIVTVMDTVVHTAR